MTDDAYSSDAAFERRIMEVTGLLPDDVIALGEAQEREKQERVRAAGYCCWAGAVNSPEPCPWHEERPS